jgi:hypothetical protein
MSDWRSPDGHPVDEAKAREMVKLLGRPSREFLGSCCLPLYWWATNQPDEPVLGNGTVTLMKTPSRVIGLTADHVIVGALEAFDGGNVVMQLANTSAHDLRARIIARSSSLDLASFSLDGLIDHGWTNHKPLEAWPPVVPQEGRGIMIGGYPGNGREKVSRKGVSFGFFGALVIARAVNHDQISCLFEREYLVESAAVPAMPPNYDLGGISGGPVINVLESPHLVTYRLGGIVSEASSDLELVLAKRADFIKDDGSF